MNKYIFLIAIIVLLAFIRIQKREKMYASWYFRPNYPIGQYDPNMAATEVERNP